LKTLKTLSFLHSGKNVVFLGPTGTGKTHLGLSIGYECCQKGYKAYFIKLDELKAKFAESIRASNTDRCLSHLAKFSCLIIDEVGHCTLTKDETRLFFQLVDRYYQKKTGSIVLTSNLNVNHWDEVFFNDKTLECALDRILDDSIVFSVLGQSYRGRDKVFTKMKLKSRYESGLDN